MKVKPSVVLRLRRSPIRRDQPDWVWRRRIEFWRESICLYCGEQDRTKQLVADHIEPLSRGGQNAESNHAPVCRRCNASKADMFLLEWVLVRAGMWKRTRSRGPDRMTHTSFRLL